MTAPEIRYRRLLALYPRDFRQEYGDEMLGVLMADPRPGFAQGVDVVRGALVAHFHGLWVGQGRAARVVQVFGAMLLFALAVRRVIGQVRATVLFYDEVGFQILDAVSFGRFFGWGIAVAAAFLGWRLVGAAGATIGLAGEILAPASSYLDTPATVLYAYWLIVAAVVVLTAGLVAERGTVRPRSWPLVAAAGAALVFQGVPPHFWLTVESLWAVPALLALVLTAVAVLRQEPGVRSRLVCWAAPVLVTVPMVQWGFGDFIRYNMGHPDSTQLIGPLQWALLVLAPAAVFIGASLVERRPQPRLTPRSGAEAAQP